MKRSPASTGAVRATALLAMLALGTTASAQRVEGSVALGGGAATDQRGVHSSAASITPALLMVPDPRLSLSLSATGTRFQTSAWAASGSAGAGLRLPLIAGLALAASASGTGTTTSYDARYLATEATPTLEATIARLTLFGGAHLARGSASLPGTGTPIAGPLGAPASPASGATSTTRTSRGPVYGGVLAFPTSSPDVSGTLVYREERAGVQGIDVHDRALAASWVAGRISVGANAGTRDARDEQATFGGVSAAMMLSRAVGLQLAAGSYASSRTLGTPGGRYATLGLLLRGVSMPEPSNASAERAGLPRPAPGMTRLVLTAPGARRVEVAGDWNQWATMPATRAEDGRWYADVRLPRGDYRYAFRIDGGRWTVPDGVATIDDGFGGRSALLTVR